MKRTVLAALVGHVIGLTILLLTWGAIYQGWPWWITLAFMVLMTAAGQVYGSAWFAFWRANRRLARRSADAS